MHAHMHAHTHMRSHMHAHMHMHTHIAHMHIHITHMHIYTLHTCTQHITYAFIHMACIAHIAKMEELNQFTVS